MNDAATVIKILSAVDYSKVDTDKRYIFESYLVEAYIRQDNFTAALDILDKGSVSAQQGNASFHTIQLCNSTYSPDVSKKMIHYLNISTVHLMSGNLEQSQRALEYVQSLFSISASSGKEIPVPILNCLIYLNLKSGKPEIALELLKKRRMSPNAAIKIHPQPNK